MSPWMSSLIPRLRQHHGTFSVGSENPVDGPDPSLGGRAYSKNPTRAAAASGSPAEDRFHKHVVVVKGQIPLYIVRAGCSDLSSYYAAESAVMGQSPRQPPTIGFIGTDTFSAG